MIANAMRLPDRNYGLSHFRQFLAALEIQLATMTTMILGWYQSREGASGRMIGQPLPRLWREARRVVLVLLASLGLGITASAAAGMETLLSSDKEWSEEKGWNVYWNADLEGCFAERPQSDGTVLLLGKFSKENDLALGFRNDRLGFVKLDQTYQIELSFDRGPRWSIEMVGSDNYGAAFLRGGYADATGLRRPLATRSKLTFWRGEEILATVSLKGTGAAFKAIEACKIAMLQGDVPTQIVAEDGQRALAEASKLESQAIVLFNAGKFSEAVPLIRRILEIREKVWGPDHPDVATSLTNLGTVLAEIGDLAGAEPLHRRALAIREKALGPDNRAVAKSLNELASLLRAKGDSAGAEPLYRRALAIYERILGPNHDNVAGSLNNLAILLRARGDLAGAEPLHRRSLAIREKTRGPDHPDVAASLDNLGVLLGDKGELTEAEALHRRALAIRENALGPDHIEVAASLQNLASMLRRKGDLAEAETLFRRALAILENSLGPEHADVALVLNNLAGLLRERGDIAESLKLFRRTFQIGRVERGRYLVALYATGAGQPAIITESLEVVQRTATSEAGAALRSLSLRFSAGGGELAALVRSEQDLAQELSRLERDILAEASKDPAARSKSKEEAIRARTALVASELEKTRTAIASAFPDFAELSQPSTLSLPDIQALLADDEALIVIDSARQGDLRDFVWAVTRDAAVWKQIDSEPGMLTSEVAGLREVASGVSRNSSLADDASQFRAMLAISDSDSEPIGPELAFELYRRLLGPVEETIRHKAHLIFVLNGAVSSLPPQMLVTKPSASDDLRATAWLIRDHAITIMPTVSSLKLLRSEASGTRAPKPFRGYGDPVFDPAKEGEIRTAALGYRNFFRGGGADIAALKAGLPRLPGTGRELRAVASSLGVPDSEVVLREKASEAAVKAAKLDDYNIVYFATHGLVAGEVEQIEGSAAEPALALTIPEAASERDDGLLTASEVAQLKLNAKWVVLSACNTAAEGKPGAGALSGLARAFFYAGARSVLVSHWVVDDEATAELMSRTFAAAAANPGRRQAEALRDAMLSLINDPDHPEWAQPRYWAPFVLVGEAR